MALPLSSSRRYAEASSVFTTITRRYCLPSANAVDEIPRPRANINVSDAIVRSMVLLPVYCVSAPFQIDLSSALGKRTTSPARLWLYFFATGDAHEADLGGGNFRNDGDSGLAGRSARRGYLVHSRPYLHGQPAGAVGRGSGGQRIAHRGRRDGCRGPATPRQPLTGDRPEG